MWLATAAKRASLMLFLARLGVKSAYEYRGAFWLQMAGVIINNSAIFILMWLVFHQFGSINGWELKDTVLVFGFMYTSLGSVQLLCGNIYGSNLGNRIADGGLDSFLLFPQSPLFHLSIRRTEIAGLGDLVMGLLYFVIGGIITSWQDVAILPIACLLAAAGFYGVLILVQSLTFWITGLRDFGAPFTTMTYGAGQWPHTMYAGAAKVVMTWLLPSLVLVYMPAQLIDAFSLKTLGLLALIVIGINLAAIAVFNRGLRRYESGNLITTNI